MFFITRCLALLIITLCAATGDAAEESPTTLKERTDSLGKSQLKEIDADLKTAGAGCPG